MTNYEKIILFAKLFRRYYPKGTTLDTVYRDSRQPFKSKNTIRNILEHMVKEDILIKVALTASGSFMGAPPLYVLREDFEIPKKLCPHCNQEMPDDT